MLGAQRKDEAYADYVTRMRARGKLVDEVVVTPVTVQEAVRTVTRMALLYAEVVEPLVGLGEEVRNALAQLDDSPGAGAIRFSINAALEALEALEVEPNADIPSTSATPGKLGGRNRN